MCFDWSGGDWHEVVAAKRNLNPYRQRASVDNYHGGAGGSVRQTHAGIRKHVLCCNLAVFKKWYFLPLFSETQRNWSPFSWLHPHAEGTANQMEPLDSEVIFLYWHICTFPVFHIRQCGVHVSLVHLCLQPRCCPQQRCGAASGAQEKS